MAGVQQIEPSEGAVAQPAPVIPAPPLEAGLGEGLQKIGHEVFKAGMSAYGQAAQASAQAAETAFQDQASQILAKYRTQYGWNAVSTHQKVSEALAQARQDALESLPSKMGQSLYNNSTLRIHRYAQESADAHYEQQNKVFQLKEYQGAQVSTIDSIRQYPLHADELVKEAEDKARKFFESHGASPDQVEAEVIKARSAAAANAVKTMAEYGNRELLGKALEKWGDAVTPQARGVAEKAYARSFAAKVVDALPRIDDDKKPDDRGYIPYGVVVAATAGVPEDTPARDVVVDAIWKGYHDHTARFNAAGAELEHVVDRLGQGLGPGGTWGIPKDSKDWEDFQQFYSTRSKLMSGKADRTLRTNLKVAIQSARGYALESFEQMDPEVQKTQTYAQVAALVRTYEVRATGEDIDKVWKRVEQIKTAKGDAVSQHMHSIVKQSLRGAFGKDDLIAARYAGMARDYAEALHAADPAMKEEEIVSATVKEAPKWVDGLFTKGKPFVRAPRTKPTSAGPAETVIDWEIGPDGVPRPKGGK